MSNRNLVKVFLLVSLLTLSLVPFSQANPKRGRKRAFGVGLLGGALAGGVIGNVLARSHQAPAAAPAAPVAVVHHHYPAGAPVIASPVALAGPANPEPKKMTVIETGTPDANGCYKQTIREPNPNNPKSYTETQHLICPTLQQANQPAPAIAPSVVQVPVMPQPSPVFPPPAAGHPAPAAPVASPVAAPIAHVVPAAPVASSAPVVPVAVAIPAPAPAAPAVQPNAGQPQVILLSKKTVYYPKKRSSAPSLIVPQGVLFLLVIFHSIKAFIF
ncbi:transcription initiation factor TFIID subunit 4 [Drosophila eugracilis]|uniref:transcription initiation factor TFIID subunit 4 n=1 Tax=Drosophila eugracilis TaxID=29029 RepID=UPI001BDAE333|nr:transcription initiation factor TFIID subunit 4 [Drosophila eugracilis]